MGNIVVLTRAGVSAESGLGTFRDKGGLWNKFNPTELANPRTFARDLGRVHEFYNMRRANCVDASPNEAHFALAKLERDYVGKVLIVTQNVDDVMALDVGTIDGIARQLGRDVLFLALLNEEGASLDIYAEIEPVTNWLEVNGIIYRLCTACEEGVVYIEGGPGCIYLDVEPNTDLRKLAGLVDKFGPVGGPQSVSGLQLSVLTLENALKNAEQDDPSF